MFSLPRGTEMFHFPRFPLPALCVQAGVVRHDPYRVFLFGDPRIDACLAAPRGLSQPATSFIGFQRLGIHRVPFATCRDDARARYGVLKVRRQSTESRLRGQRRGRHVGPAAAWFADEPRPSGAGRCARSATFKAAQRARHTPSGTPPGHNRFRGPPRWGVEMRVPTSQ